MSTNLAKLRSDLEFHKLLLRKDLEQVVDPRNTDSLVELFRRQADRNQAKVEELEKFLKENTPCTDVPRVKKPSQQERNKSKSLPKRAKNGTKTKSVKVK
jgi:hypothetical protein